MTRSRLSMRLFMHSILDGAPVLVDGLAGRRALAAAIAVKDAMDRSNALVAASGLLKAAELGRRSSSKASTASAAASDERPCGGVRLSITRAKA